MKVVRWWTESSLILKIVVGLIAGVLLGILCPSLTMTGLLGDAFVGALKAIAPVLVALLVTSSIAKAGGNIKGRFRSVILMYLGATVLSALVAVCASFLFPVTMTLSVPAESSNAPGTIWEVFANLIKNIVANPVQSIVQANYIGILFWSVIIGLAMKMTRSEKLISVVAEFADTVSVIVGWIIQFAPFGIMGLVFSAVSTSGLGIFVEYGKLILLLVGCMAFTALVINPAIVGLSIRRNPYPLLWMCLKKSGVTAFFTRSSAANIPVNMELCKSLGLDKDFYSVSIPLGATINMNGGSVTITVLSLAVCHTLGIEIDFASALLLSIVASFGACGASGVAGGSLLLVPMACALFGVSADVAMQAVAVGFIIGVVQDSVETCLNSSSDVLFTAAAEFRERRK